MEGQPATWLWPDNQTTATCFPPSWTREELEKARDPRDTVEYVKVTIIMDYVPALFPNWDIFRRERAQGFQTVPADDNALRWTPAPASPRVGDFRLR